MEILPEMIVRALHERSKRPPLTSRSDPDFGSVWLVWMDDDQNDPNDEPNGYGTLTEWLGVIDLPGKPQALLRIEWIDHGERDEEEFRALYEALPVEASAGTRSLFRRALRELDQVLNNVRTKLKNANVSDWEGRLTLAEGWIIKDELYLVFVGQSFTADCFVRENLDVRLSGFIPDS